MSNQTEEANEFGLTDTGGAFVVVDGKLVRDQPADAPVESDKPFHEPQGGDYVTDEETGEQMKPSEYRAKLRAKKQKESEQKAEAPAAEKAPEPKKKAAKKASKSTNTAASAKSGDTEE